MLALSKGPDRAGVSLSSPENGKDGFRNVKFSSNLEIRMSDRVHKPSDSDCDTPSSESLRFYCPLLLQSGMFREEKNSEASLH
jgi:hypothetical protein